MKSIDYAHVLSIREVVEGHFVMALTVPRHYRGASPGQFIMLRIPGRETPFLGRPFSIHRVYGRGRHTYLEILFRVSGAGTRAIAGLEKGDSVALMGPLGHGFDIPGECDCMALVAGGMGMAPLRFLAERTRRGGKGRCRIILYFGARTSSHLYGLKEMAALCDEVAVATDDGSRGYRGPVTSLLDTHASRFDPAKTALFACGPGVMLQTMAAIVQGTGLSCQVSVEERMACGIGACLGCAVPDVTGNNRRVCKEGPVFSIEELAW